MRNNHRLQGPSAITQIQEAFGMSAAHPAKPEQGNLKIEIRPDTDSESSILPESPLRLPDKFTLSARSLLESEPDFRHEHIARCARNPDPGSDFNIRHSAAIRKLKNDAELFAYLLENKFGGAVYTQAGRVVGHVFYQEHAKVSHVFSIFVAEDKRGHGLGSKITLDLIKDIRAGCKIEGLRIGKGTEPFVKNFLQRLDSKKWAYSISNIYPQGWVEFSA